MERNERSLALFGGGLEDREAGASGEGSSVEQVNARPGQGTLLELRYEECEAVPLVEARPGLGPQRDGGEVAELAAGAYGDGNEAAPRSVPGYQHDQLVDSGDLRGGPAAEDEGRLAADPHADRAGGGGIARSESRAPERDGSSGGGGREQPVQARSFLLSCSAMAGPKPFWFRVKSWRF